VLDRVFHRVLDHGPDSIGPLAPSREPTRARSSGLADFGDDLRDFLGCRRSRLPGHFVPEAPPADGSDGRDPLRKLIGIGCVEAELDQGRAHLYQPRVKRVEVGQLLPWE